MSGLWDWWRRVRGPAGDAQIAVDGDDGVYAEIEDLFGEKGDSSEEEYAEVREPEEAACGDGGAPSGDAGAPRGPAEVVRGQDQSREAARPDGKEQTDDEEDWSEDEEWERTYNRLPTVTLSLGLRPERAIGMEETAVPLYVTPAQLHSAEAKLAPIYSTVVKPPRQGLRNHQEEPLSTSNNPRDSLSTSRSSLESRPVSRTSQTVVTTSRNTLDRGGNSRNSPDLVESVRHSPDLVDSARNSLDRETPLKNSPERVATTRNSLRQSLESVVTPINPTAKCRNSLNSESLSGKVTPVPRTRENSMGPPEYPARTVSLLPPPLPPPDWDGMGNDTKVWKVGKMRRVKKWMGDSKVSGIQSRLSKMLSQDYLCHQGQSGFEDLRRYIKQGGDFCKELTAILQERAEAEAQYGKTLAKLSCKLVKATKEGSGTVNAAWHRVAVEMEAQADVHRNFASSLSEDVVRPLKQLVDSQHRIRKSVETAVDKSGKSLAEWRAAETKAKKTSFTCARDNEKLRDSAGDQRTRLSSSSLHIPTKNTPEKESAKMETKRRKAEECVKKADVEYYSVCLRAERSRLEWESAVLRGSHCFQVLEEERLRGLKDFASSFLSNFTHIGPKITQIADRLSEPVKACDLNKDLETVTTLKAATEPSQEQILPDFYPEHTTLAMNRERRKVALIKLLELIRADLERERRGKAGVENLAVALKRTPTFASEDSQQNVQDKLHHMRSMLTYLEAARYKVLCVLSELEGRPRPSHPLADHINVSRDRQGYQQSVLKVPSWIHTETEITDWVDRGTADGTSVQPDSDFELETEPLILKKYVNRQEVIKKDEFSSQGSEKDYETVVTRSASSPTRCRALYNYTANLYDELSLNPGDIINIHDKQPDGWWLGELNGVVGIFPATYVEEIKLSQTH